EAKKNLLIEKSKRRREKIADAGRERQKLAELSRDLAANVLIGRLSLRDAAERFDALPEPPAAIPRRQLFRASKKKFQMLPEIRKKREKLLQEFEICTNRIRVKMYSQKQLSRTLAKPQSSRTSQRDLSGFRN
uniref:ALMS motif domain-containing protein n=1 Tax=Romanomermis culicivorax TaxID=13658 RepID=A0A915JY83_ROMCU